MAPKSLLTIIFDICRSLHLQENCRLLKVCKGDLAPSRDSYATLPSILRTAEARLAMHEYRRR
jgi:hypothetical protein